MCSTTPPPPPDADDVLQAAVLRLLLSEHPTLLTEAELARELTGAARSVGARDRPIRGEIQMAVRDLVGAGLVHRQGELLLPSRAALRFDRLPID